MDQASELMLDEDDLAAEIARLEAELGLVAPFELAQTVERPVLTHQASQIDYVNSGFYVESDDECSVGMKMCSGMSYDEITVDTSDLDANDMLQLMAQQQERANPRVRQKTTSFHNVPHQQQQQQTSLRISNEQTEETLLRKPVSLAETIRSSAASSHPASPSRKPEPASLRVASPKQQQQVATAAAAASSSPDFGASTASFVEEEENDLAEMDELDGQAIEEEIRRMQEQINAADPAEEKENGVTTRKKKMKKVLVRKTRKKAETASVAIESSPSTVVSSAAAAAQAARPAFLSELQQHRKPPNLLAELQQRQPKIEATSTSKSPYNSNNNAVSDDDTVRLEADIRRTCAEVSPSISKPAPTHAAPAGFLAEIQQRKKPPNFLAEIQQRKPAKETSVAVATSTISHNNLDDEAERLQVEILKMQAEIASTQAAQEKPRQLPARPPMLNLLGAIEKAATSRVQRLEATGGELVMQNVAPEVEAKQSAPRQLSTSMAEMISQRAAARDKRLADGGEKRMRKVVIKEKDEYRKDFSSIVTDAAAMGRLTRLNEYTVEAIAQEKKPEEEWKSNGLLAIQWRSSHMTVIHDAAKAGNAFKLPEQIVTNFSEEEQEWDPETSDKCISSRMRQLLELDHQVGEGQQKVEKLVLGRKEGQGKLDSLLIKPMQAYVSKEDIKLPRSAAPKINPAKNAAKLSKMKKEALMGGRPMIDISAGVAEIAWERRARLDRPGSLPKIREVCPCPYCGTASPYQTFAYRELERKHKEELLLSRQKRLQQYEELHGMADHEDTTTAVMEEEACKEVEVDEVERKRRERQRIRAERRALMQAVAEAEAAVIEAQAAVAGQQPHCMPVEQSAPWPPPPKPEAPKEASSVLVKERVGQWNASPPSASPYAQTPPSAVDAGCKCVIM